MPGMQSGIGISNTLIAEAFRSALRQQLFIVAAIFLVLWLARLIAAPLVADPGRRDRHRRQPARPAGKARTGGSAGKARTGEDGGPPARARAARPTAAQDRLRHPLDLRRDPAGAARDATRDARAGHQADRGEFARLGPAPGERAGTVVDLPPDPDLGGGGLDPGRDRPMAAFRPAGAVGQVRRAGQRRLGTAGLGIRRVLRRHLRPGPDLAVRRAGRSRCSTAPPERCWPCRRARGARPGWAGSSWPGRACSSSAWRCCRPGRDAGSGRERCTGSRAPSPA